MTACRLLAFMLLTGAATTASAQATGAPPTQPRTLVGIVVDSDGAPLDSAEIRIDGLNRSAFSRPDGTFTFENIRVARYSVTATKVGYSAETIRLAVPSDGAAIRFRLGRFIRGLPPSVTVATRTGIAGIVSDSSLHPLAGATVYALGMSKQVATDSVGGFYIDAPTGRYLLRVRQPGYRSQLVSVHVPENAGRKVAVWLVPGETASANIEAAMTFDLNERLAAPQPSLYASVMTREDLAKLGDQRLELAATFAAKHRVDDVCEAYINGGPLTAPLWTLHAADVEMMEVYTPKPKRMTAIAAPPGVITSEIPTPTGGAPGASGTRASNPSRTLKCATVYAWIRR